MDSNQMLLDVAELSCRDTSVGKGFAGNHFLPATPAAAEVAIVEEATKFDDRLATATAAGAFDEFDEHRIEVFEDVRAHFPTPLPALLRVVEHLAQWVRCVFVLKDV